MTLCIYCSHVKIMYRLETYGFEVNLSIGKYFLL